MASIIKIKRSSGTALPSNLHLGELAVTYGTGTQGNNGDRLLVGTGGVDENGYANNIDVVGGKYFTDMLDHVAGTLTASSAIIVGADSKIDVLNVDNITLDGNTISTSTGNLTLNPTGDIDANNNNIINVTDPTADQHAATKAYVDAQVGASTINISNGSLTSLVDLGDSDVEFVATTTGAGNGEDGDITTSINENQVLFGIRDVLGVNTAPGSNGVYTAGSATEVPVITANRKGQITAISSQQIASTFSVAGDNSTSATVNLLTDTLTFAGGTGIASVALDTTDDTTDTVTVTADIASISQVGVASFAAADFNVDGAGEVTISSVSNAQLAGSIANEKLAFSSISVTDGSTSNDIALGGTLTFAAGEGIDVTQSGGTVTVTAEIASETNPGIATFDGNHFDVDIAGDVTIRNGAVDADQLAGTLDLTGKTISVAAPTADAHAATRLYVNNQVAGATGANLDLSLKTTDDLAEGSQADRRYYTQTRVDSDARAAISLTTAAASGSGALTYDNSTGAFVFTPASATSTTDALSGANGINYDSAAQQFTLDDTHDATFNTITTADNVTVGGNLVVQGTTTTINTETLTTTDPLMHLADSNDAGDVVDIGFIAKYNDGTAKHTGFFRDATDGKYKIFDGVADGDMNDDDNTVATGAAGFNAATMVAGTFEGNLTGDVTGDVTGDLTGDVTGNADTATALETARNFSITGDVTAPAVSFDGSGNVALNAAIADAVADGATKGIATFTAADFDAASGVISLADEVVKSVTAGTDTITPTSHGITIAGTAAQGVSVSGAGSTATVTVGDAAADGSTKGVAAFNSTNFSAASGVISTENITVAGTNGASAAVTNGGTLTFATDSRSGTTSTGITTQVIGGNLQVRQVAASTTVRGAALFADSDFEVDGAGAIAIKTVDGGTF